MVLRPDGQVMGGPVINAQAVTNWSDPDGLRPCGGRWAVYKDPAEGKAVSGALVTVALPVTSTSSEHMWQPRSVCKSHIGQLASHDLVRLPDTPLHVSSTCFTPLLMQGSPHLNGAQANSWRSLCCHHQLCLSCDARGLMQCR